MDWFNSALTKEFESFFNTKAPTTNYDISSDEEGITLKFEVPGIEKEDLKVKRRGNNVIVTIKEKENLFHCTRHSDLENLTASHRLGILTVTVPYLKDKRQKEQEVDIL